MNDEQVLDKSGRKLIIIHIYGILSNCIWEHIFFISF